VRGGKRAVFLDRDGVLVHARVENGRPLAIRDVDELAIVDDAEVACHRLRSAGFLLLVVTNQPEVARGTLTRAALDRIHRRLREALPLDEIIVCPHDDADMCACRKPLPGMLVGAATRLEVDLGASFMVGDRWRDVEAGRRAGCSTVLLEREYSESVTVPPDIAVHDLSEAAAWILARSAT
jgi:D-glycero-D-manno-heptose 1,7-bisphosphate phosphatase